MQREQHRKQKMKPRSKGRKRQVYRKPLFSLQKFGQRALLLPEENERTPIFLHDLQHLVMKILLRKHSPCSPGRWCTLNKSQQLSHTVVVCIEGLSLQHFLSHRSKFGKINKLFDKMFELFMSSVKNESKPMVMIEEFIQVLLIRAQADELIDKYGSLEAATELLKDPMLLIDSIFPVDSTSINSENNDVHPTDKFPRTKLLLTVIQMISEDYPVPLRGELNKIFSSYTMTKDKYASVTNRSPFFGIDCIMCRTSAGVNEPIRISIRNENFETVYETLIRPANDIVDYLTESTGITEEVLSKATKNLCDVRNEIRNILPPDAILVGHSLNKDLNAMQIMHPYVIDTSICFNLNCDRRHKDKLKKLASKFLNETIQEHGSGVSSTQNSVLCLKLVKLKLANSMKFGDEILLQKTRLHNVIRNASGGTLRNNLFAHANEREKRTSLISTNSLPPKMLEMLQKAENDAPASFQKCSISQQLSSNDTAVYKCKKSLLENTLTLCNLHITPDELRVPFSYITMKSIDKWIFDIWESMTENSMLLVVMGNTTESSSGLAKIAFKRNFGVQRNIGFQRNSRAQRTVGAQRNVGAQGRFGGQRNVETQHSFGAQRTSRAHGNIRNERNSGDLQP